MTVFAGIYEGSLFQFFEFLLAFFGFTSARLCFWSPEDGVGTLGIDEPWCFRILKVFLIWWDSEEHESDKKGNAQNYEKHS